MKRITAIAIVVSAVLGCSYVGSASAVTPCEQMFNDSALVSSGLYDTLAKGTPAEAEDYKQTTIEACNSAIKVARQGVGPAPVAHMLAKSVTHKDSLDSLLSLTRVDVVMKGWAFGAEK